MDQSNVKPNQTESQSILHIAYVSSTEVFTFPDIKLSVVHLLKIEETSNLVHMSHITDEAIFRSGHCRRLFFLSQLDRFTSNKSQNDPGICTSATEIRT